MKSFKKSRRDVLDQSPTKIRSIIELKISQLESEKRDLEFDILESDPTDSELFRLDQIDDNLSMLEKELEEL